MLVNNKKYEISEIKSAMKLNAKEKYLGEVGR